LRVAFVERRLFQQQKDGMLNPVLQVPDPKQDALGLGSGSVPLFAEAVGEPLFLLRWLQFSEQQGMAIDGRMSSSYTLSKLIVFPSGPVLMPKGIKTKHSCISPPHLLR
jgi:hypothetical protein